MEQSTALDNHQKGGHHLEFPDADRKAVVKQGIEWSKQLSDDDGCIRQELRGKDAALERVFERICIPKTRRVDGLLLYRLGPPALYKGVSHNNTVATGAPV